MTTRCLTFMTLNGSLCALPLFNNFLNGVGCFFPLCDMSMGSNTLMVDDKEEDLTMHSNIRPRQIPLLKKDVCDERRFPRFNAAVGSVGSKASSGKAVTLRSSRHSGFNTTRNTGHGDVRLPANTISSWNSSRTSTCVTSGMATTLAGIRNRSSRRLLKKTPSSVPYIIRLPPSAPGR